jgi:hypothetical protein
MKRRLDVLDDETKGIEHSHTSSKKATSAYLCYTPTNHCKVLWVKLRVNVAPSISTADANDLFVARDSDRV